MSLDISYIVPLPIIAGISFFFQIDQDNTESVKLRRVFKLVLEILRIFLWKHYRYLAIDLIDNSLYYIVNETKFENWYIT